MRNRSTSLFRGREHSKREIFCQERSHEERRTVCDPNKQEYMTQARNGGRIVTVMRDHTLENTLIPFVSLTSLRFFYLPPDPLGGRGVVIFILCVDYK